MLKRALSRKRPEAAEAAIAVAQPPPTPGETNMAETATIPTYEEMREKLSEVQDPEINMSIVELGLVYDITIEEGVVNVTMTLTSPGCPLGPIIRGEVYAKMKEFPVVKDVDVNIVWNPPWDPRTMASEDVKMALGIW